MNILSTASRCVSHILFPKLCLSCHASIFPHDKKLCDSCFHSLRLIDLSHRCRRCCSPAAKGNWCGGCSAKKLPFERIVAPFPHAGAAAKLLQRLKARDERYLADDLAAFMALQFSRGELLLPDTIVSLPKRLMQKNSPSELLAHSLSKFLARPVVKFAHCRKQPLVGKAFLLVDALLSDHLIDSARILRQGYPHRVDALLFSLADE